MLKKLGVQVLYYKVQILRHANFVTNIIPISKVWFIFSIYPET